MRRRREKYKGGGLHRGKGLPRAVRRGRGERARPEGDLKLKLPRFRLDEFISLAGKIARGAPPPPRTAGSRFLWTKWESFDFAKCEFSSFINLASRRMQDPKIIISRNLLFFSLRLLFESRFYKKLLLREE